MYFKTIILLIALSNLCSALSAKDGLTVTHPKSTSSYLCAEKKCIMKCCEEGHYLNTLLIFKPGRKRPKKERQCKPLSDATTSILNLDNEDIFFNHPSFAKYNFTVKSGIFQANKTFMKEAMDFANMPSFNIYLTEDPEMFLETPNAYYRWTKIPNDRFCWDYKMQTTATSNLTLSAGIWVVFPPNPDEPSRTSTDLMTSAMLVSCFFLLLVLLVYGALPELRNLCGLILMAYVASLLVAFLLLAAMRIQQHSNGVCLGLTYCIYYSFLASFCWMNVMSYDIWWTFRGYAKARPIHRRGENFKFLMYCLYAFGLPLAMAIMLAILNHLPLQHKPWIITPKIPDNGCFIEGGEKLLYLYVPMLVLIVSNWMFYLMTAFNIWRLSRGTAVLDSAAAGTPQAHRTQLQRLMVYVKLSVVMGLNWVLEVVSYKFPGQNVWLITDFYNILIGLSIFLIFVCKRKILRKLIKRYLRCKSDHWRPGKVTSARSSSTSDSNSSNETQSLQICANPKGPVYVMKPE